MATSNPSQPTRIVPPDRAEAGPPAETGALAEAGPLAEASPLAGVPLGGIGTGCIELGRDARFRNITINNNRSSDLRIPVSAGAFLAVRAVRRGKVLARILHPETGIPFERAGIAPTYARTEQLSWRGLYPCSHYELADPHFPVEVKWTALSPIIPHDVACSTLPVALFAFHLRNPAGSGGERTGGVARPRAPAGGGLVEAAILFNWENLAGCQKGRSPEERGRIAPVILGQDGRLRVEQGVGRGQVVGLGFGTGGPYAHNAEGNYCLLALPQSDAAISVGCWNERDPEAVLRFWEQFHDKGRLDNEFREGIENHSGAMCCSFTLPAGGECDLVLALAWYCPRFEVNGRELGNGYAGVYPHSLAVAQKAVQSCQSYIRRVNEWQQRLVQSSVPEWLSRGLINNSHVLSTNTLVTRDGRFAMMESASEPLTGAMDRRLYSSLGTLVLFPELEERELELLARAEDRAAPGRFYRYLGVGTLHEPSDLGDPLLETSIKLVLQACRNHLMTGKKDALERLFPRLQRAMAYVLAQDRDGDGLPEQTGCSTTYDAWAVEGVNSYTSSLWLAALRAYTRLAEGLGQIREAKRYEALVTPALASFEQRLWDEEIGHYRFFTGEERDGKSPDPGAACHAGQLAGQWYADFLGLGRLFPSDHIHKVMEAVCRLNEKRGGVIEGAMGDGTSCGPDGDLSWPGLSVHFLCLLMYRGYPDRGLYVAGRQVDSIHRKRGRPFNQPLCWNAKTNDAAGRSNVRGRFNDRHMGAMSLWYLFYALEGFLLSVPDETVRVRPNLPRGVHGLSAPLFTPLGIGWLNFVEEGDGEYRQRVRIALETRAQIRTIVLGVPAQVEGVEVQLAVSPASAQGSSSAAPTTHRVIRDADQCIVEITLDPPAPLSGAIEITLRQNRGEPVRFARAP